MKKLGISLGILMMLFSCQKDLTEFEEDNTPKLSQEDLENHPELNREFVSSEGMSIEEKLMSEKDLDIDNPGMSNIEMDERGRIVGMDEFNPEPSFENPEIQTFAQSYYISFKQLVRARESNNEEALRKAVVEIEERYDEQQRIIVELTATEAHALNDWMTRLSYSVLDLKDMEKNPQNYSFGE